MQKFILRDKKTLAEVGAIESVFSALISEEINASYTLTFNTIPANIDILKRKDILIEADGDYFEITRWSTKHGNDVSVDVDCEHVSYSLIDIKDEADGERDYEGTALMIAQTLVSGTQFTIESVDYSAQIGSIYIKPSGNNPRDKLLELAKYLKYEIIWDKYSIDIVEKRGSREQKSLAIGTNVQSFSTTMSIEDGEERYAYELDVIDFSQLNSAAPGAIALGDDVKIIDPLFKIESDLRILTCKRDPFKKALAQLQVGRIIFDFFNYDKTAADEKESKDKTLIININSYASVDLELSTDTPSGLKKGNVWTEWATVPFTETATILFVQKYRSPPTINVQIYGSTVQANIKLIEENENGVKLYTGVVITTAAGTGTQIAMHAIGRA